MVKLQISFEKDAEERYEIPGLINQHRYNLNMQLPVSANSRAGIPTSPLEHHFQTKGRLILDIDIFDGPVQVDFEGSIYFYEPKDFK